ncbi:MAG: hypothetical protein KJO95_02340, partial [Gammaproteobacteria bacterium]|nr:hypothetical protein [Gammaproteobacteria bacterium]
MDLRLLLLAGLAAMLIGCEGGDREVSDFGTNNSPGTATVSGVGLVGETLTADFTDPDGVDFATVAYQWYGDGAAIAGANGDTYMLTAAEGRQAVSVRVQYTDGKGLNSTAVSNSITVTALNSSPTLVIDVPPGGTTVGEVLTAVLTDDNGFGVVNYQWIGSVTGPLAGETAVTLTLTDDHIGENISVNAVYTDDDGYDEDLTSAEVGPVAPPAAA